MLRYLRNVERYIADHGIEVTQDPLKQLVPPHRAAEVRRRFDAEFGPAPWDRWDDGAVASSTDSRTSSPRRASHHPSWRRSNEWVLGAAESWGIGEEVLEEVKSLKEAGMIYAGVEEQKERAYREGLGRGRREGRAEGLATLLCRQARLKFGARTAERLAGLLEGVTDPEAIARIGDRIIECETGEELLARARVD